MAFKEFYGATLFLQNEDITLAQVRCVFDELLRIFGHMDCLIAYLTTTATRFPTPLSRFL